ncbi:hypothetical protein [Aureimonas sp. AU20]|uniref:hypothetical protein n=1 Tax=Aureimonas sp. AU20 TaxID=1349819 RepID=UPI000720D909|nr:hypothetical protein [Aureimonas sp. AU20]ALN71454.1 hypothetical protein M673_01950 [Aureimonas sp. AU20]
MSLPRPLLPTMAVGCLMLLGGCTTSTDYAAASEAMRNSPALLADRIDACTKSYRASPAETNSLRQEMKLPVGTSEATVASTACWRGLTAIAQGRMTYDDFMTLFTEMPRPIVYRVIQGR